MDYFIFVQLHLFQKESFLTETVLWLITINPAGPENNYPQQLNLKHLISIAPLCVSIYWLVTPWRGGRIVLRSVRENHFKKSRLYSAEKMGSPACRGQTLVKWWEDWEEFAPSLSPSAIYFFFYSRSLLFGFLRPPNRKPTTKTIAPDLLLLPRLTLYAAIMSWMTFFESWSRISTVVPGMSAVKFFAGKKKIWGTNWSKASAWLWDVQRGR